MRGKGGGAIICAEVNATIKSCYFPFSGIWDTIKLRVHISTVVGEVWELLMCGGDIHM